MSAHITTNLSRANEPGAPFEIIPAHDVTLAKQRELFNAAFAGYVAGSVTLDAAGFARLLSGQGVDLCYSRFIRVNGRIAGFGFINRTGDYSRLAGMGLTPAARGTGAAGQLLTQLLGEARARQDRAMLLECFEQNPRALSLYRQLGFVDGTRLLGWHRTGPAGAVPAGGGGGGFREVSLLEAARWPAAFEYPDLPWQVSRHAIPKLAPLSVALAYGDTCIVLSSLGSNPVRISALLSGSITDPNWESLRNAVAALTQTYPDRSWVVPAIHPEDAGHGVFGPLGFTLDPLNQVLMKRSL